MSKRLIKPTDTLHPTGSLPPCLTRAGLTLSRLLPRSPTVVEAEHLVPYSLIMRWRRNGYLRVIRRRNSTDHVI